ncbi:hypothetical protein [Nocardioides sp.]|uniref:hypothetical protein n=1 Tax=Nocardioides sp. TaxID=35761 RepID=UPI0035195D07
MSPVEAASRAVLAILPANTERAYTGLHEAFSQIHDEAGAAVLADVVRNIERSAILGRRAA